MSGSAARPTRERLAEIFASSGFRRLLATRAVSQVGDGIFQLATADLLLFDKPGPNPALTLTILSAVTLIPFSAISPFVGVFIDRWDRRKILEITPIVRAALAVLIGIGVGRGQQGAAFFLIVLAVLSVNRFFLATMAASLPQVVPEDDLLVANSAASTGGSVANVIGLGAGAGLAALIGGTQTAGVAAIAFGIAALLARGIPVHAGISAPAMPFAEDLKRVVHEMADGVRRIRQSRRAVFALTAVSVNQGLVGAMTAAVAVYFIRTLRLGVGATTSLLALIAVGIAIGVALVPALARRIPHDRLIPLSFALAAVALLASGLTLSRPSVVAGGMLAGLAYAMTKIPVDTIVQQEMPDSHRGRAFAAYDMLFNVARVGGTAATAAAVQAGAEPRAILLTTGVAYLVASAAFLRSGSAVVAEPVESRIDDPAVEDDLPPIDPAAIPNAVEGSRAAFVEAGEMVAVRSYAGHRAEADPRSLLVAGREIPIDAVDWRALEERPDGTRRHIFVVRAGGARLRLAVSEDSTLWEVERVLPSNEMA